MELAHTSVGSVKQVFVVRERELKMADTITIKGKTYEIHTAETAAVDRLPPGAEKRSRTKRDSYYVNDFGTFDIETTSVVTARDKRGRFADGYAFMYVWQFYSASTGLVMGRYWPEFFTLLRRIGDHYGCEKYAPRFVSFIHNEAFEAGFFLDQLTHAGFTYEIFAVKNRKPIVIRLHEAPIEFRCSYKLTNRGLAKYLDDFPAAGFAKMSGDLDYRIQRTPKTKLTDKELGYCAVDVIGLHAAISLDLKQTSDTVASVPLTSTGYVRRDFKNKVIKQDPTYKVLCAKMAMTPEVFQVVLDLAKGGDTLGSASQELGYIHKGMGSEDYISQYPAQLETEPYPMGRFEYEGCGEEIDLAYLKHLEQAGRYYITEFVVYGVEVREKLLPIPCINEWKCYFSEGSLVFNGRLLRAQSAGMALDMVSFQLFRKQYKWEKIEFGRTWSCIYAPLPKSVRDFVLDYFRGKCELKDKLKEMEDAGLDGTEEYVNVAMDYQLYKNRFNGIFGMFYTKPVFQDHDYDPESASWIPEQDIILDRDRAKIQFPKMSEAELDEYIQSMKNKLFKGQITAVGPYIWGVHTAALGRYKLAMMIEAAGYENVVYSDTDSIKFKINEKSLSGIAALKAKLTKQAMDCGAYIDTGKHLYVLGVPEDDGIYEEFVTLGAKRYAYRDKKGLHITVSGVQKKGVEQLNDDIKNFRYGKVFNPAGGIMLHYIQDDWHVQHVVGDDGTEDDIELGNSIVCEERIVTLGGIPDDRFGLGFTMYKDLLCYDMSDDDM